MFATFGRVRGSHWAEQAACAGANTNDWFPERGEWGGKVLKVCAGCPVRIDCLDDALAEEAGRAGGRHGIRGGLTPNQRSQLAKDRAA